MEEKSQGFVHYLKNLWKDELVLSQHFDLRIHLSHSRFFFPVAQLLVLLHQFDHKLFELLAVEGAIIIFVQPVEQVNKLLQVLFFEG